jgi:hypothetical protein
VASELQLGNLMTRRTSGSRISNTPRCAGYRLHMSRHSNASGELIKIAVTQRQQFELPFGRRSPNGLNQIEQTALGTSKRACSTKVENSQARYNL